MSKSVLSEEQIQKLTKDFEETLRHAAVHNATGPAADRLRTTFVDFIERAAHLGVSSIAMANIADAALTAIARQLLMETFEDEMRETLSHVIREEMKKAASPARKTA